MPQDQLDFSEIAPCEESSYIPLPKEQNSLMKGLINTQNDGIECFRCGQLDTSCYR